MAQKEILFWDTATPGSKDHQWLTERVAIYMDEHPDVVVKLEPQASDRDPDVVPGLGGVGPRTGHHETTGLPSIRFR